MPRHGFLRVAAAVPRLRVADGRFNADHTLALLQQAQSREADLVVFPELGLTGYTCADLFHQTALQADALAALERILHHSAFSGLAIVGLPLVVDQRLFNVAAAFQQGHLLALVPKTYLPNYKEFYEARWFAPGTEARPQTVSVLGQQVPFGTDLLLDGNASLAGLVVGIEICEDLWVPSPPCQQQALAGATILCNLSASNEIIGKAAYRRQLVTDQAGRCIAGYVYTSCGVDESTTDLVFGGHALIADNGNLVAETPRFQREDNLLATDIDVARLVSDRQKQTSFFHGPPSSKSWRRIPFQIDKVSAPRQLIRKIDAHPFVPSAGHELAERCQDIFHTQVAGLAKRLEHIGKPSVTLGVSGGLDSTLALLVTCKTLDLLGLPRRHLAALTMPGFGTGARTRTNALALMRLLNVESQEIDIRSLCLEEMRALGQQPFGIALDGLSVDDLAARLKKLPAEKRQDLAFENVQARMRTSLLMNRGFVIGTGDVSELALGWCTYNADQMNMYNPNVSIPKTLVKFLVRWAAENEFDGEVRRTLLDIVDTRISPELLPTGADGAVVQETESVIGPYELHDFFLFHFLRYGAPPEKILYLAHHAQFDRAYTHEEVSRWLAVFLQRFFANQFKRSCMPDGPKVGSISLSPRGDWRMPSDAAARAWLERALSTPR